MLVEHFHLLKMMHLLCWKELLVLFSELVMYCFLRLTFCLFFGAFFALRNKIYSLYRCLCVLLDEKQYSSICCHIIGDIGKAFFILNQSRLICLSLGSNDYAISSNNISTFIGIACRFCQDCRNGQPFFC